MMLSTYQRLIMFKVSFAYIWLDKGNQKEFLKYPKIKWLDGGTPFNFRILKEFVLISFIKPDVCKTLNIINL